MREIFECSYTSVPANMGIDVLIRQAAVDRPKVHLWETGIIRITRHPQVGFVNLDQHWSAKLTFKYCLVTQMVGQVMWSIAHMVMIGTSFTLLTMALLVGHHLFAAWHGDQRLLEAHGKDFLEVCACTAA